MRTLIAMLLLSFIIGCDDDDTPGDVWPDPLEGLSDEGPVQFDNPVIGQRSHYLSFTAFDDNTPNLRYEYRFDTLVLAITGKESDLWIVKQFLTEGSISRQAGGEDLVYITTLDIDADSVYFADPSGKPNYSYVFAIYANDRFALPLAQINQPATHNPACSPFAIRYSDAMQYASNYTQLGKTFDHLNIYGDNSRTDTDGPALMWAYGPAHGIVRMSVINPWVPEKATGWDLVSP